MLLALLDSNAADQTIRLATGSVSNDDLVALGAELQSIKRPHLVRIGVIHHHVLPIAYTSANVVGAEPFMVLHNAGDVLDVLARYRFDLMLHGHKHRSQFARIDIFPDTSEGYPIAVAAAGSAALAMSNQPRGNNFNAITIQDNGRIIVRSLFYGSGVAPDVNGPEGDGMKVYTEMVETTKRRAFIRASQRHPAACKQRELRFEVSEHGDLRISHGVDGLRATRRLKVADRRSHYISVPPHGRRVTDLELDDDSFKHGYRMQPAAGATTAHRTVLLPRPLDEGPASYLVRHACANCVMMTRWEADERAPAASRAQGWDEEFVSANVVHPVDRITLSLTLPESLLSVEPYVRCERRANYPDLPINDAGDASIDETASFIVDPDMEEEERRFLRFYPSQRRWELRLKQPVVGYRYQLRWRTPGSAPPEPIPGETRQYRRELLHLGQRLAANALQPRDRQADGIFGVMSEAIQSLLGSGRSGEDSSVELFVYDTQKLALCQVLSRRSWSADPPLVPFEIKLGEGIAGAAFVQRRIVPWAETASGPQFIKPVPNPEEADMSIPQFRTMLAVPTYHTSEENSPRPSPWSAIAVVSFGSSSDASKIPPMLNQPLSKESEELLRYVRALSQACVHEILQVL
jgi:hypothetical protein